MGPNENSITDVEPMNVSVGADTIVTYPLGTTDVIPSKQPTQEQIMAYMQHARKLHNSNCRKKGFKDHIHQQAGHKLERKLSRHGSLYGRLSMVAEMFKDIREQKFKYAKQNATYTTGNMPHMTNSSNPVDFPKDTHGAV